MTDAWILPRGDQSFLFRRTEAPSYRKGVSPLVEVGPIPMPVRAVHRLDTEADTLVHAHRGALTVIRGLSGGGETSTVKIPGKPVVHALFILDDVVFTGGDAGKGMFGWVDLRAPLKWKSIAVPGDVSTFGKGIDGFAVHGSRLVAVDDIVLPRYLLLSDVTNPRAPGPVESRILRAHSSAERVVSVASSGDTLVLLSHSANHGGASSHLSFLDLPTLEEWAVMHVQRPESLRRWANRSYDFHAVALHGDHVLVAAGKDGIGVLELPRRPDDLASRKSPNTYSLSQAQSFPVETMRFVPVPEGPVIDVVPVEEARAFAVVEVRAGGILARNRLDSVLVSLTS